MFSIGFNNRRKREEILNLKYFDCYPLSAPWSYLHEMYVMENISRWILDFWVLHIHSYPSPLERQERKTCTRVYTNVPQDVIFAHNTITAKQKYSQVSAKNIIIMNIFVNIRKPEYQPVHSVHLCRVLLKWWNGLTPSKSIIFWTFGLSLMFFFIPYILSRLNLNNTVIALADIRLKQQHNINWQYPYIRIHDAEGVTRAGHRLLLATPRRWSE